MLRLALASLRRRPRSAIGAYLALFCAAAMVCACGVLLETGLRGEVTPQRYAGTPVVVSGDQQIHWTEVKHKDGETKTKSKNLAERVWLPAAVGADLAAIDGATVVPDRTFPAALVGAPSGAPTQGHNWSSSRLTPYRLEAGAAPRSSSQVVVDRDLARREQLTVGAHVRVQSTQAPATYTVAGIAAPRTPVASQAAIFFADPEATRLAAHGSAVTAYGVFGAGRSEVAQAVRGTSAQVSSGADRGAAEFPDAEVARVGLTSLGGAIGGTSLLVALLVVAGTFSLTVQQRARELALLRAVGATPAQVRRLIGREAFVLGLLAAVPGAVVGLPLASVVHDRFVSLGALPDTLALAHSPFPPLAALVATVLAAIGASRISARRVTRIRPAEALAESVTEREQLGSGRTLAGLVVAAAAGVVTVVQTLLHTEPAAIPVTYLSILLWMIAVALLGPLLARAGAAVLRPVWRLGGPGGFLAAENSARNSRRAASVLTPLALLIGMTMTILFVPTTLDAAAQAQTRDGLRAALVVDSDGPGVPAAAVDRIRRTPGVTTAAQVVRSTIWVGRDKQSATGISPAGLGDVVDPSVVHGSLSRLGHGTIAMSSLAADGRSIGDTVRTTLGDGTRASYRLVAIYERGLAFGDTLLPFDVLHRHVDDPLASAVLVAGTVDRAILQHRLADYPGLRAMDRSGYAQAQQERRQTNAEASFVLLAVIIAFTAIAVANTLVMATLGRRRELGLIRVVGATRRQVRGSLRGEVALVLVLAAVLGSVASWLTLTGFSVGMAGAAGPTVDPWAYLAVLAGVIVLGAVASGLPVRALLRRDAVEQLRAP